MKINLKQLELTNFKVVRSKLINFQDKTNIYAANGVGKTTLKDAFLWLLFGKDSTNRKDFAIKTLDGNNQPFHNLDHEVTATIDVDGETIVIKRSMREKWTKKKGSSVTEFTGHETSFFWNDVPCQLGEFQKKVDALVNEELFRLITSTNYFPALPWQNRRQTLLDIAGVISNDDVLDSLMTKGNKGDYTYLFNALNKSKSPEDIKKEISAKIRTIKQELDLIPSRIDEANRSLPEMEDYEMLTNLLTKAEQELQGVENDLLDKTRVAQQRQNAKNDLIREQGSLHQKFMEIEFRIKNLMKDQQQARDQNITDLRRKLLSKQTDLSTVNNTLSSDQTRKGFLEQKQTDLRKKWADQDAEKFVADPTPLFRDDDYTCPTCKRAFDAANTETKNAEMLKNFQDAQAKKLADFNQNKAEALNNIVAEGSRITAELTSITNTTSALQTQLKFTQADIAVLENQISNAVIEHNQLLENEATEVGDTMAADQDYILNKARYEELSTLINVKDGQDDNSELVTKKATLVRELDSYKSRLTTKTQREKIQGRIEELKSQEKTQAQEIATLQGIEFSIENFTKAKMDELERRINNRFQIVKFKMFEEQINGGQSECCEILIDGVPYSDANTASKINAGLDIINTLCNHYNVYAPIFVDNRESVVDLIDTNSQIINLIVSKPDTIMRIEYEQAAEAVA